MNKQWTRWFEHSINVDSLCFYLFIYFITLISTSFFLCFSQHQSLVKLLTIRHNLMFKIFWMPCFHPGLVSISFHSYTFPPFPSLFPSPFAHLQLYGLSLVNIENGQRMKQLLCSTHRLSQPLDWTFSIYRQSFFVCFSFTIFLFYSFHIFNNKLSNFFFFAFRKSSIEN